MVTSVLPASVLPTLATTPSARFNPASDYYGAFPPLPPVSPAPTSIPFEEVFKHHGIQMFDEGLERHASGAQLTWTWRADAVSISEMNTVTQPRRRWWDIWMEDEETMIVGPYDMNTPAIDRLYRAAHDFRNSRVWLRAPRGLPTLWDQFCFFIDISPNSWTRTVAESILLTIENFLDSQQASQDDHSNEFLNDPELKIEIFLSTYIYKQGLIRNESNLTNLPRLVGFFIRFLIRNHVFPEFDKDHDLERSLAIVKLAEKELVLTSKIAKQVPDEFGRACIEFFGSKSGGARTQSGNAVHSVPFPAKDDVEREDRVAKTSTSTNIEMIKLEVDDHVVLTEINQTQINTNSNVACGAGNKDNSTPCPMSGPIVKRSLLSLLGPTAFPLTHTAGIVERSVRRIKSYSEPPAHDKLPKSPVASHAEPEAVEIELEGRFAKVVLEPWIGWDDYSNIMPSMAKPRILGTSFGPVHGVVGVNGEVEPLHTEATTTHVQGEGLAPHDPFMDDITVLVDPALLPSLSAGMGIGGTWVQLARQVDFNGEKENTQRFTTGSRYWYIDELALVLPSYLV